MTRTQTRPAALKRLIADIHRRPELGFGFRLRDGSTVPDDWPTDKPSLAIADEGAVARGREPCLPESTVVISREMLAQLQTGEG